jgi:hypothetical protein
MSRMKTWKRRNGFQNQLPAEVVSLAFHCSQLVLIGAIKFAKFCHSVSFLRNESLLTLRFV